MCCVRTLAVISDFYAPNFGTFLMLSVAHLYAWEAIAHVSAIVSEDSNVCVQVFMGVWHLANAAVGLFVGGLEMIWPFRLFYYILPGSFCLRSLLYVENKDVTYESCETTTYRICWGEDGQTVLTYVHYLLPAAINEDTVENDIWAMLGLAIGFKIIYSGLLCYRVYRTSSIKPGSFQEPARSQVPVKTIADG